MEYLTNNFYLTVHLIYLVLGKNLAVLMVVGDVMMVEEHLIYLLENHDNNSVPMMVVAESHVVFVY